MGSRSTWRWARRAPSCSPGPCCACAPPRRRRRRAPGSRAWRCASGSGFAGERQSARRRASRAARGPGAALGPVRLDELAALTRQRLAARERRVVPPGPLVRAAVLVPLVDRGEPYLVFAKRTDTVGSHRGQIGFPGGTVDPSDASLLAAALRECEEEIGLPPAAVEPLGALDDTETFAANLAITPRVAVRPAPGARPTARPA